ncbi:MAG: HD domain-containing protein [Candidatus Micrarchaeia archaeon]|jgi:putative nucleotidyltransferase with HDIG domain
MKKKIIDIVKEEHTKEDFNYHILLVVKNALFLGKKLNADLEVLEIAAYLHDIGRAEYWKGFDFVKEHNIVGYEKSRKILKQFDYSEEFIEKVSNCILSHTRSKGYEPKTLEEEIIVCADAMAHFDSFLNLFNIFLKETDSFEEAIKILDKKIDRDWNIKITFKEAKEASRKNYEAVSLLIKNAKDQIK